MKREMSLLIALVSMVVIAPTVPARAQAVQASPNVLNEYLGPELIAWSQMQDGQPMPQPAPKAAPRPDPKPDPQPETQPAPSAQQPANSSTQPQQNTAQQDTQTLTGTIVTVKDRCVLRVPTGDTTYELDNQVKAKQFEGKRVKVVGRVDSATNTIHVDTIELIS